MELVLTATRGQAELGVESVPKPELGNEGEMVSAADEIARLLTGLSSSILDYERASS